MAEHFLWRLLAGPAFLVFSLSVTAAPALAWSDTDWSVDCAQTYAPPDSPEAAFYGGGADCRYESHHPDVTRPVVIQQAHRDRIRGILGDLSVWYETEGWRRPEFRVRSDRNFAVMLEPVAEMYDLAEYDFEREEITIFLDLFTAPPAADTPQDAAHDEVLPELRRQTVAHEFFHAIQFAHRAFRAEADTPDGSADVAGWITEGTAEAFGTLAVLRTADAVADMGDAAIERRHWYSDYMDARFSNWPLTVRGFGDAAYATAPFWVHVYLDHFDGRGGALEDFFDDRARLPGTDGGAAMDTFLRDETGDGLTRVWLDFLLRTFSTPVIRDDLRDQYYACDPLTAQISGGAPWVHEDAGIPDNNLQVRCFDIDIPAGGGFRTFSVNWDEAGDDPDGIHHILVDGDELDRNTHWRLAPGEAMRLTVIQTLGDPDGYDADLQRDVPVTFRLERREGCDPALGTVDLRLPDGGLERHAPRPDPNRGDQTYYYPGGLAPMAEGPGMMTVSGGTLDSGEVCAIILGLSPTSEVTDEMVENAATMLFGDPGPEGHGADQLSMARLSLGASRPTP